MANHRPKKIYSPECMKCELYELWREKNPHEFIPIQRDIGITEEGYHCLAQRYFKKKNSPLIAVEADCEKPLMFNKLDKILKYHNIKNA
ncbi:MAG: hypothetical protein PVJ67_06165 [Candidatus Pacearchaeota archaeon]|jgi:hypothetical protein